MTSFCDHALSFPGQCDCLDRGAGGQAVAYLLDGVTHTASRDALLDQAFGFAQKNQIIE